jgi:hypothetical protein
MYVIHDDDMRSTGDVMSSTGDDMSSTGDDMSSYKMSKDNSISNSSTKIQSDLTKEDARRILNNIFINGYIREPDSKSLCEIVKLQQIHDSVGVKQKVQVGGDRARSKASSKANAQYKLSVLKKWLTHANTIFDTKYIPSTVDDDPVKVAFNKGKEGEDDYNNLKKLHIFLKLLILKTILEKTKIHLKYEHKKRKNELLKRMCVKVNEHFGEFDVAAAMFIIFCGQTLPQQVVTGVAMTACMYSATYAPQICSLLYKVMSGPVTDLVSYLFSIGLPTLIAGSFAAKSAVEAIQNFQKSLVSTAFPRPQPEPTTWKENLEMLIRWGFNFATDMSPVAAATLPNLSNLAQTMFASLMHIKQIATDAVLDPVIRLFLDTFSGSDRIFKLASVKPEQFGMLLLDIIAAVETIFPGGGEEIALALQSSSYSKFHASAVSVSTRHPPPHTPNPHITHSAAKFLVGGKRTRDTYDSSEKLKRINDGTSSKGGSTIKSPQNMTKSTLKKRFATMNKRHNQFRFHVSKNNSRLYKNRHRVLTSKLRKNNK